MLKRWDVPFESLRPGDTGRGEIFMRYLALSSIVSFVTHLFLSTRRVVGWIQFVDQVVLPPSLQMEIENRPKFARTRLITVPSSHSMSRVEPSHPYLVLRSEPEMNPFSFQIYSNKSKTILIEILHFDLLPNELFESLKGRMQKFYESPKT